MQADTTETDGAPAEPTLPAWEQYDESDEYHHLCRARIDHLVEVREPVVLISQIQRSGGTLLSQLFDGHPECHAHPYELKIALNNRDRWPAIKLDDPRWFETLFEQKTVGQLVSGYSKPATREALADVFPFLFLPRLQKQIFDQCVAGWQIERERDIFDCYFTSYFNAWLDNQNLYSGPKRIVTAFSPSLSTHTGSTKRFMATYPDGTLVSIVRDPRGWYASAFKHKHKFGGEVDDGIEHWRGSTEAILDAIRRYGADRVVVITYEELVIETERTMERLAKRLGISMSPALLVPTFNGQPIRANSSQPVERRGVIAERASAYREVLDPATIERVEELAGELYERARALAAAW